MSNSPRSETVTMSTGQALRMLGPYVLSRIIAQVKSVWLIVAYLVLFQVIILDIPVADGLIVGLGVGVVIVGLAFFMEGLFLGLMPLGESCGIRLPRKTVLPVILLFAFVLGLGATFAEPAIGVLKMAGYSVKAWDAPLLYLLLNKYSTQLVWAVGGGVGTAVLFGMLRFLYHWSLKPFLFVLYPAIGAVSIWAWFDPNLVHLTGLAWDCGAVTTGPVTVPLVLALGIGISRVASEGNEGGAAGGFGVVTLASAFPIIAVLALGLFHLSSTPPPMTEAQFADPGNRDQVLALFDSEAELKSYVLQHGSPQARISYYGGSAAAMEADVGATPEPADGTAGKVDAGELLVRNGLGALQAIVPLSLLLLFTLLVVLRERVRRFDEVLLGIVLAVAGMTLFSIGIELGLSRLGSDIGTSLPSSFKPIELSQDRTVISNFDPSIVGHAITEDGELEAFFPRKTTDGYETLPYLPENLDAETGQYSFTPTRGPLFGSAFGVLVVIIFGFMMGFGATLAEPALNALGTTVEELTVGTFRKSLLMQAVALGVGVGIAFGVAKIIFGWPLIWMVVPPYVALMVLTAISDEEFVDIAWDSAGVTTGPVTVPLVLAMGLGISGQVGSIEGFGILALASAFPVLGVLIVGLYVTRRRQAEVEVAS